MEPFTYDEPPSLFACGHVVCYYTCADTTYCPVCHSLGNELVANPFYTLLQYFDELQTSEYEYYNFCLVKKNGTGKGVIVEDVCGDSGVEDLMVQSQDFINFFYAAGGNNVRLVLNGKVFKFNDIRDVRLCDIPDLRL